MSVPRIEDNASVCVSSSPKTVKAFDLSVLNAPKRPIKFSLNRPIQGRKLNFVSIYDSPTKTKEFDPSILNAPKAQKVPKSLKTIKGRKLVFDSEDNTDLNTPLKRRCFQSPDELSLIECPNAPIKSRSIFNKDKCDFSESLDEVKVILEDMLVELGLPKELTF